MIYSVWTGVEQKGYYADTYIYSISLLYCFMGFWAKNGSVWLQKMAGYPWDCYDYKSTRGAKRWNMTGVWTYILRFQRIFCVERTAESHIGRSCLKYLPAVHLLQMQRPLFDLRVLFDCFSFWPSHVVDICEAGWQSWCQVACGKADWSTTAAEVVFLFIIFLQGSLKYQTRYYFCNYLWFIIARLKTCYFHLKGP